MLIKLIDVLDKIHGKQLNKYDLYDAVIANISTDSRNIKTNDCFIALKGENFNGNNFALDAHNKGASLIIVDENIDVENFSCPVILVENCINAYAKLANIYRNSLKTQIIGVTGSVGKTTTKNLLGHCLDYATKNNNKVFASIGNLNNHIGVPKNLFHLSNETMYAVIEMGMQQKGEIDFLSKTAEPNIAIINNISEAHLEFFENLDKIAEAKAEIFHGLKKNGTIVLNQNTNCFDILYGSAKQYTNNIILYTINKNPTQHCDIRMLNYKINDDNSADISLLIDNSITIKYHLPLGVISLIENSLAVFATFKALNLDYQLAIDALKRFPIDQLNGRGQIISKTFNYKNLTIIDETYNSGVHAMKAALQNLAALPFSDRNIRRRVAILGEMRELGKNAKNIHADLINHIDFQKLDLIMTIGGENIAPLNNLLPKEKNGGYFQNSESILPYLDDLLKDGDLILIKGARGNYLEKIINYLN